MSPFMAECLAIRPLDFRQLRPCSPVPSTGTHKCTPHQCIGLYTTPVHPSVHHTSAPVCTPHQCTGLYTTPVHRSALVWCTDRCTGVVYRPMHWCGVQTGAPSGIATEMPKVVSYRQVPIIDMGVAWREAPEWGAATAISRAK